MTPKNLEGFVWSFLSITGWHLRDNLPRNAHFWQVGLLDIIISEYPDKSHDFYDVTPPDRPTSFWKKRRPWGRGSHPPTIHFKARVIKLHGCLTARHCHHFRRLFDLLGKGRNVSSEYLGNMQWNYLETRSPWFHQHSSGCDVQFDIKSKGYHLSDSYQTLIIDLE